MDSVRISFLAMANTRARTTTLEAMETQAAVLEICLSDTWASDNQMSAIASIGRIALCRCHLINLLFSPDSRSVVNAETVFEACRIAASASSHVPYWVRSFDHGEKRNLHSVVR